MSESLTRHEFERESTKEEFENLLKQAVEVYEKVRYYVPLDSGLIAELDIYFGKHKGVITIEVEFESETDAKSFNIPEWFGEEIDMNNLN